MDDDFAKDVSEFDTIAELKADIKKILPKVDMTLSIENQIKEALKLMLR